MKKSTKQISSLLLASAMLLGMITTPVSAVETGAETAKTASSDAAAKQSNRGAAPDSTEAKADKKAETVSDKETYENQSAAPIVFTVEGSSKPIVLDANAIDLDIDPNAVEIDESVTLDMDDPLMLVVESELKEIKVLDADGESKPLTETQIQTILYMFQQYTDQWAANADVLGVQLPFFLSYNDNGEDGLGVLGEMLAIANVSVADVRSGSYSYDDILGMIQNFTYGDRYGVEYYGEEVEKKRDEVLDLIEKSGAQTEAQKLLVLNDWLAEVSSFDMPYIMNMDKTPGEDPGTMIAEDPQPHEHFDDLYNAIYADYEKQLDAQFRTQIRDGLMAQLKQQFYEGAIENVYKQGIYQQIYQQVYDEVYASIFDEEAAYNELAQPIYNAAYAAAEKDAWDKAYADAETAYPESEEGKAVYNEAYEAAYEEYLTTEEGKTYYDKAIADAMVAYKASEEGKAFLDEAKKEAAEEYDRLHPTEPEVPVPDDSTSETESTEESSEESSEETSTPEKTTAPEETDTEKVDPPVVTEENPAPAPVADDGEPEVPEETKDEYVNRVANEKLDAKAQEVAETAVADDVRAKKEAYATEKAEAAVADTTDTYAQAKANAFVKTDEEKAKYEEAANAAVAEQEEELRASIADTEEAKAAKAQAEAQAKKTAEAQADAATEQFMTENADAIKEDPKGFILNTFGEEAAAQIDAQLEAFLADAEENGIALDQSKPDEKTKIDDIVEGQMNQPLDALGGMTPNEAVPKFADQAANGMANGVLGYWEGSQFGALAGSGNAVCLGYAKAFAYLVQCMHPEIYGVNGADTDMSVAANWKKSAELYVTDENGVIDINQNYVVDLVRITYDASVSMFGEKQDNFDSDHFWNAIKVDGTWYYIDTCYTDIYSEVMIRDRVETDGNMNHLYFLFSHTAAVDMYKDNYKEIKTLYEQAATNTNYEDSWMARIKSNVFSDGEYFYYIYDSSNYLQMIEDQKMDNDISYKMVRHKITKTDAGTNGDNDYEALIEFNAKGEEEDSIVPRIKDIATGAFYENETVTELYAKHVDYEQIYPSIALTCALYDGKLYFNLANTILTYDLTSSDVTVVKEYNTVSAVRDKTNPFGGKAFSVVYSADDADFTVENRPIAGLMLKNDGKLYVAIATNFAYISGNDDQTGYGYAFEESNYNPDYNTYYSNNSMMEMLGYDVEINDNDEFMWAANFVETLSMSHFAGTSHSYKEVAVDASCWNDAYTEDRCTECGVMEAGSRKITEDTAHEHHYIRFDETYYTKDDSGNFNTGFCYVCVECGAHVAEPTEPDPDADYDRADTTYEEQLAIYKKKLAEYEAAVAIAGHTYVPTDAVWKEDGTSLTFRNLECTHESCHEREATLDLFIKNQKYNPVRVTFNADQTGKGEATDVSGSCTDGLTAHYVAKGTAKHDRYGDFAFTAETDVKLPAGTHTYVGTFTWEEVLDEEGNATGEYTATAEIACANCDEAALEDVTTTVARDEERAVAATCEQEGQKVFVATAAAKDADGKDVSVSEDKIIILPALGHNWKYTENEDGDTHNAICETCGKVEENQPHTFEDGFCTACGAEQLKAPAAPEILSCYSRLQTTVKVTWTAVEGADGYEIWRATAPAAPESEWERVKSVMDGSTTVYTNHDLTVGTTYYYKMRAFVLDSAGERVCSEFSDINYMPAAVVMTSDNAPYMPYSNSTTHVRLVWREVSGAYGYQIWRQDEEGGDFKIVKVLGKKDQGQPNMGNVTVYTNHLDDDGADAGKTYTYKMRAVYYKEDGTVVYGVFSDEFEVAVMPKTPNILSAESPRAGRAVVSWEAVNGADAYQLWMADSADGTYRIVRALTGDSLSTSYTKYELESGKTYYFKVRANTFASGKEAFSAFSDVAAITVK